MSFSALSRLFALIYPTPSAFYHSSRKLTRGEPLEDIFADIRAGMDRVQNGATCVEVPNRRDALLYALGLGCEGDILAVLGKGHETTIDRDGRKVPFEDAAVVREYMERVK